MLGIVSNPRFVPTKQSCNKKKFGCCVFKQAMASKFASLCNKLVQDVCACQAQQQVPRKDGLAVQHSRHVCSTPYGANAKPSSCSRTTKDSESTVSFSWTRKELPSLAYHTRDDVVSCGESITRSDTQVANRLECRTKTTRLRTT